MNDLRKVESLYIHFPWCKHICNYCDFYKSVLKSDERSQRLNELTDYFTRAISLHENLLADHGFRIGPLKTMFVGGGTPSLWGNEGEDFFSDLIEKGVISFADNYEFTAELNPSSSNDQVLSNYLNIGANRFSIGVQSLDQRFLKVLDRIHTSDQALELLGKLQKKKLNYSADFMLGLPYSEEYKRDIIPELEKVLELGVSHLSLYILTVKSNYVFKSALPSEDYIADEYLKVCDYLGEQGFIQYEVSNFAKPGFECQHNLAYWRAESVAALGPSGTGFLKIGEESGFRYKWMGNDLKLESEVLGKEEMTLEKLYLQLRTNLGVDLSQQSLLSEALSFENEGLAYIKEGKLYLNSGGYLVLDSLVLRLSEQS